MVHSENKFLLLLLMQVFWFLMVDSCSVNTLIRDGTYALSAQCGLKFPVELIGRSLRQSKYVTQMGAVTPIYLAAVLEYLCAEILELAEYAASDEKKKHIVVRHITLAVKNNEELNRLFGEVTTASGDGKCNTYSKYIKMLLEQIHPDTKISEKGMSIVNSFINNIFERIAHEAGTNNLFISALEIQAAVRVVLPCELAKYALLDGTRAFTRFSST